MTKPEWRECRELEPMLYHALRGKQHVRISHRKLQLFLCACCRQAWDLVTPTGRRAVETAERYADGEATYQELFDAGSAVRGGLSTSLGGVAFPTPAQQQARLVDQAVSNASWPGEGAVERYNLARACVQAVVQAFAVGGVVWEGGPDLFREVYGDTPDPVEVYDWHGVLLKYDSFNSRWVTAEAAVLAQAAYLEPREPCPCRYAGRHGTDCQRCHGKGTLGTLDPLRLAVLADALEEAGCDGIACDGCVDGDVGCPECEGAGCLYDPPHSLNRLKCPHCNEGLRWEKCKECGGRGRRTNPVLAHLRSPGPHVRGCWALDVARFPVLYRKGLFR